jgi:hypothetical protein
VADHSRAEMIKAFARDSGLKLRGAQWNAKNETTKWKAWLAVHRGDGVAAQVVEFELLDPPASEVKERGRKPSKPPKFVAVGDTAEMERVHWELWVAAAESARTMEDVVLKPGLMRAANEARKAYEEARKARVQAEIEARELLPASEFIEFRQRVAVICGLIERAGPDIAPGGNPENPVLIIREWSRWLAEKFNPQVAELMAAA